MSLPDFARREKMPIGDRIKEARIANQMTQHELADVTKIQKSTISEYETGKMMPTFESIIKLMNVLEVDAKFLFQDYPPNENYVDHREYQLLSNFRSLPRESQEFIIDVMSLERARAEIRSMKETIDKDSKKKVMEENE